MRVRCLLVLIFVGGIAPLAGADTLPVLADSSTRSWVAEPRAPALGRGAFAIGVNSPVSWFWPELARSLGVSLYAGLGAHHAVRANFAYYNDSIGTKDVVEAFIGDGTDYSRSSTVIDGGIAWVWYPRRLWEGFTLEAGALRRARDITFDYTGDPDIDIDTATYAGRAMIGWSWVIRRRVFIAIAAGISVGREAGRETTTPPPRDMEPITTRPFDRVQVDGEGYLRIGFAYAP